MIGSLALLLLSTLALGAGAADAAFRHPAKGAEFGVDGKAAGPAFNQTQGMAYHQASKRLYVLTNGATASEKEILAFDLSVPGVQTPIGGNFPIVISPSQGNMVDLAVDNSATETAGNLYFVESGEIKGVRGFTPDGEPFEEPVFPVPTPNNTRPCGVAVDNTGHYWLTEEVSNAGWISKYSPVDGAQIEKFNVEAQGGTGKGRACEIEIDQENNDIFAAQLTYQVVNDTWRYRAADNYSGSSAFKFLTGTDARIGFNSATKTLFSTRNEASGKVSVFDPEGSKLEEFGAGAYRTVVIDEASDTVILLHAPNRKIEIWPAAIVPDAATGPATANTTISGSFDPAGGGPVTECYFEYGTSASYGSTEPCDIALPAEEGGTVSVELPGLTEETTYHYRLVVANAAGQNAGPDRTFVPHHVPFLTTGDAEEITRTGAKLTASFDGNGEETSYYFEWGTTAAYGDESAVPPGDSAGSPTESKALEFEVEGLQPDTVYHYRVVAENAQGVSHGFDATFKTLPAIQSLTTTPATNVVSKGAQLNATYEGDGTPTTYYFEYGQTTGYGFTTPVQNAGSTSGTVELDATLTGLPLETTYNYRVVATNALGTTKGENQTFTTQKAVELLTTKPVSSVDFDSITFNAEFRGSGLETHYYFEYGLTPSYGLVTEPAPGTSAGVTTGPTEISTEVTRFEAFTTYHYRVVAVNALGTSYGEDVTFTTEPVPLPEISGTAALEVTPTTARLRADINPKRWATDYIFEWGTSTDYGEATLFGETLDGFVNSPFPVEKVITGLRPGTLYHFRTVAINLAGVANGPDMTFITPGAPRIDGSSATVTGQGSVRLSALVAGNGRPTDLRFELGTSPAYGQSSAARAVGADLRSLNAEIEVAGLAPGTTYHYRAVATNEVGTTTGIDGTFTTLAAPAVAPPPNRARGCRKGFVKRKGKCVKKPVRCKRNFVKRKGKCVKKRAKNKRRAGKNRRKAGRG